MVLSGNFGGNGAVEMKRWITSLLVFLLVFALAACGSRHQSTDAEEEETASGKIRIVDTDLFSDSYVIAVSKDNDDLLARINLAIEELQKSKTLEQIEQYYVSGRGSKPESGYVAPDDAEVLRMGTCADLPPYIYYEDGEIVGVDVAVAECIAEKLGMKLEIVNMRYDAIVHKLAAGEIDIGMAAMTETADVASQVLFSNSYSESNQVLLALEDSEIDSIGMVYNLIFTRDSVIHIGVVRNSVAYLYTVDDFGEENVRIFETYEEALRTLEQDQLECVIMDDASARYYLKTMHS